MFVLSLVFFFKQKTAYEMLRSLVGSEMCIRDRVYFLAIEMTRRRLASVISRLARRALASPVDICFCLLYTSDAADDLLCVDLGGRRIIKKKKIQSIAR